MGQIASGSSTPVDPTIAAMTAKIAAGHPEALCRFYRGWFDTMFTEARRATGRDESFCLDVVQDAMMRVIRSMKPMKNELHLRRWLRVVVTTCAADRLRSESRRRAREQRWAASSKAIQTSGLVPADDPNDRRRWLREQLAALDERAAELLVMRHGFGWTLKQIGRAVGMTPGAVDGRLRRLLGTLRRKASEESDD